MIGFLFVFVSSTYCYCNKQTFSNCHLNAKSKNGIHSFHFEFIEKLTVNVVLEKRERLLRKEINEWPALDRFFYVANSNSVTFSFVFLLVSTDSDSGRDYR